jgi:hypothetical protein
VRARREAPPRDGEDPARKAERIQGERGVDRGEAGAEQQHHILRAEPVGEALGPGVVDPGLPERRGIDAPRRRRLEIAGGEDDRVGPNFAAVGEMHALRPDADRFAPHRLDPRLGEQSGEIVAVEHARRIAFGGAAGAIREPADEMLRIVGEGAHPPRRHVQQMLGPPGRISDAAAGRPRPLDQDRVVDPRPLQVQRLQGAARTAADDGDAGHRAEFSCGSSSGTGSARLRPSRMRAVSSRTFSIARCSRHLSSLMQFLHCS